MKENYKLDNKNYETFGKNYEDLFLDLKKKNISEVAANSGAEKLCESVLELSFFEKKALIDFERSRMSFIGDKKPLESDKEYLFCSSIILHYLYKSDGTPLSGEWIAYRDLPGGMFYASTIPGVLKPICNKFGNDSKGFISVVESLNGKKIDDFSSGVLLYPLPRVPFLFILEESDEEFGCDIKVCIDSSTSHYLKTDIVKTLLVFAVRKIVNS